MYVDTSERAKSWPGWEGLRTHAHTVHDGVGHQRIHRLTICMPLARTLLSRYGEFLLVDCTFKVTKYFGRHTIIISIVDEWANAHPTHVCDVPGHREKDWLLAFNNAWTLVTQGYSDLNTPRRVMLMRDREQAIENAWLKSEWPKILSTARCVRHTKWSVAAQKMEDGNPFGPERTKSWYKHVFATCTASFSDGLSATAQLWQDDGDEAGARHILKLARQSDAPLHRWTPIPCPYIASGAGETASKQLIQNVAS